MFLSDRVPPKVRSTYSRDAMAGMLGAVMNGMAMPFFAMVAREKYGVSELELGVITMAPVAGFMMAFVWAIMMEGKRKMPFAVTSWVLSRSMLCLFPLVRNGTDFVVLVALFYLLSAVASPAYAALMKEIYPDSDRGRIMGYVRVCSFTVIMIASAIGGPLLHAVSYKLVFPIAGIFGIASALVFHKIPTHETTGDANVSLSEFVFGSLHILVRDKAYRWFCAGIFVAGWANFMIVPLQTVYLKDVLHGDTRWVAAYTFATQGMAILAYYYWGKYIDRKEPIYIVALCNLLFVVLPLSYYVATAAWMLLPCFLLLGIYNSGCDLAYFNVVLRYAPKDRIPHYQAVHLFLMGVRGIIAPVVGPALVSSHWLSMSEVFLLSAVMTLWSYLILMRGMRRHSRYEPGAQAVREMAVGAQAE